MILFVNFVPFVVQLFIQGSSMGSNDTTSDPRNVSGKQAEDLAAHFLADHGLSILARNFHCRGGEIDLVCADGKALVFVEVRLRRNPDYGGAGASITSGKQRRIILAAQHYLAAHARSDSACRFDCVLLDGLSEKRIEWVRDAFSAA
ncbi:MAG: YraN family protein [Betaproteobacteria bacterium]